MSRPFNAGPVFLLNLQGLKILKIKTNLFVKIIKKTCSDISRCRQEKTLNNQPTRAKLFTLGAFDATC